MRDGRRLGAAGFCVRSPLYDRRFAIVTGKGGVGRTTVSLALGLVAARYGLRTCIVQLAARDWAGKPFGRLEPSYLPVPLIATPSGSPELPLYAANLTPADALREYGQMKLRFRAIYNLVFENDVMRRLTRMIPGMNEMLMLGKAWHMEAMDKGPGGKPTWDLLIIDAPATGHGVSLLRLPQVISESVPFGPMAEDARAMRALLEDPSRTALHVVTLPQELPATEALELCQQVRSTLGMPTGYLFINKVLGKVISETQRRSLKQVRERSAGLAHSAIAAAEVYEHWRAAEQLQIQRLVRQAALPTVELPHLLEPIGRAQLDQLASIAQAGMEAADLRLESRGLRGAGAL